MPNISICIPTYNGGQYLEETLTSVLNQTYSDFEVIIIDDQSTDNTLEIAKTYSDKDNRICFYQNDKNLGLVENWNKCVELARGNWIKFVFQDDLLAPDCLTQLATAGEESNCPIVFCKRELIYTDDCDPEILKFLQTLPSWESVFGETGYIAPDDVSTTATHYMALNLFGEPTSVLLRKDCFERFGFFNPDLKQRCDYEYWIRVGHHTGIALVHDPLAFFRLHPDSTTSSNKRNKKEITEMGDKLLLLHEYANSKLYAGFRRFALNQNPPFKVDIELNKYMDWMFMSLYTKDHQGQANFQEVLSQIIENLSNYPRLVKQIRHKKRFFPYLRWLEQNLTWRLK
ncbi:glycosyltransferase [Methylomonas sp. LL1]|uniref:glycosyltransferase n=1 Tax=Methylomonas sp. LL1 TaxID=2785785 RepID=UPI0018C411D6|nr:glycosyltransferase [Methylomonas sp. LL1]QPK65312.1 glycosyltransferase [Methylomonas sp. LL1]